MFVGTRLGVGGLPPLPLRTGTLYSPQFPAVSLASRDQHGGPEQCTHRMMRTTSTARKDQREIAFGRGQRGGS